MDRGFDAQERAGEDPVLLNIVGELARGRQLGNGGHEEDCAEDEAGG